MAGDGGAGHTHTPKTLTSRTLCIDGQAIGTLQAYADIVLTKGLQA
jgi:hypothetical protein